MSITNELYLNNRQAYKRPQAMLWSETPGTTYNSLYFPIPAGYEFGSDVPTGESASFLILSDHNRSPLDLSTNRIEKRSRMVNARMRSYHVADKKTLTVSWQMLPSRSHKEEPSFVADVPMIITGISVDNTNPPVSVITVTTEDDHNYVAGDIISIVGVNPSQFNFSNVEVRSDITSNTFSFESTLVTAVYVDGGESTRSSVGTTALRRTKDEYTVDGGAGGVEMLDWYENHTGSFYVFLAYDKYNNLANDDRDGLDGYNEVLEMFITDFNYTVVQRGTDPKHDFWNISVTLEEA
jgi:hypothetical protein